ncbi:hypothetical protein V3D52_16020 [Pseudomonas putida]
MNAMQVAFWQNVVVASLVVPFAFTHLGSTSLRRRTARVSVA